MTAKSEMVFAQPPERIFLVGMMGVGKSTIGKRLAAQLLYSFIDLDKAIEEAEGTTIASIFETKGEEYFRELEQKTLLATGGLKNVVIAVGGGTPCFFENMKWMNVHGKTIYLKASVSFVLSRLSRFSEKRPLLKGKSKAEIEVFMNHLMGLREPWYSQAQEVVFLPTKLPVDSILSRL